VFETVAIEEKPTNSVSLLAYVSVTMFYAIRIYLLRCTSIGFGGHRSPALQETLQSLILTAYRTLAKGPIALSERFQWSLLIAGMETNDIIQQEWILSKISDPGIQSLLKAVRDEKKKWGGEIRMSKVREMVVGKE
jgi:hypothetical protein